METRRTGEKSRKCTNSTLQERSLRKSFFFDKKHESYQGKEPPCSLLELYFSQKGYYLLATLRYLTAYVTPGQRPMRNDGTVAFDLGIKTLATGVTDQGRFYHIGGFKGYRWYNRQLDKLRSKRDRCKKKSRRYIHLSQVYRRVSERKRNKQRDSLHKASHLIAHRLAERAVVIGDLSQRQMVIKKHEEETPKERKKRRMRNRMVYNGWGLYGFVHMLAYKCVRFGKELHIISERDTTKMCHVCKHQRDMPLWQRTYRCSNENCGLVMDRDENSAVNIYQRFLARPGPHTDDSVRCAE